MHVSCILEVTDFERKSIQIVDVHALASLFLPDASQSWGSIRALYDKAMSPITEAIHDVLMQDMARLETFISSLEPHDVPPRISESHVRESICSRILPYQ